MCCACNCAHVCLCSPVYVRTTFYTHSKGIPPLALHCVCDSMHSQKHTDTYTRVRSSTQPQLTLSSLFHLPFRFPLPFSTATRNFPFILSSHLMCFLVRFQLFYWVFRLFLLTRASKIIENTIEKVQPVLNRLTRLV